MGMEQQSLSLHIPTQSANATDEWYLPWPFLGVWRIVRIQFAPATAVAIDATDYLTSTITVNDGAAGSDSDAIASHNTNTGGTALVLKTTVSLTVSRVTGGELSIGKQIKVAKTLANAGKILDGTYVFTAEKLN